MKLEKVLIRMPQVQELFFPAVAFVHDYMMQLTGQMRAGLQRPGTVTLELWREDQFFFTSLFPRLLLENGDKNRNLSRSEWACVIDLRTPTRALELGATAGKHVTDAWGIMFGASPRVIAELGFMSIWIPKEKEWDILVDAELDEPVVLMEWINQNFPDAKTDFVQLSRVRYSEMFDKLGSTRMYVGRRSASTYLAAMMKIPLVEYYPDDFPRTFLSKPARPDYRVFFGDGRAINLWVGVQELWQTLSDTNYRDGTLTVRPVSTAELVAGK